MLMLPIHPININPMSNKVKYILIFLALGFLAAVIAWKYTFRKSESSVSSKKADLTIEAPALLKAFETNEDSANSLYLDKIVQVSRSVGSITTDSLGYSVYLRNEGEVSGILCSFDKMALNPKQIQVGSRITIKGLCTGYLLDVNLNKCAIVAEIPN